MARPKKTQTEVASEPIPPAQINTKRYVVVTFELYGNHNDKAFRGKRGDVLDLTEFEAKLLKDQIKEI